MSGGPTIEAALRAEIGGAIYVAFYDEEMRRDKRGLTAVSNEVADRVMGILAALHAPADTLTYRVYEQNGTWGVMRRSETAVAGGLATKEAAQDWIDALAATRPDAPADCGCAYEVTPGGVYPERRYFHEPDCAAEPPEPSA